MGGDSGNKKTLKPEYTYYMVETLFSASTSFIAPVYVIFLIERGLDYKGVALVDGFYMVSGALLDYPTGGLADKYGRGRITALACLFFGFGLLSYSFSRTLYEFLFSEFLAAIGAALYSGAFIAWLVDSLKEENRSELLPVVLGNTRILSLSVSIFGAFTGGLISELSLELPFAVGAFSSFSAAIFAFFWTRGIGEAVSVRERKYEDFLKRGAHVLLKSKPLIILTIGSFLLSLALPSFTLTWAPYMKSQGASKWLLGVTSSIFMATIGISGYLGGRVAKRLGYKKSITISVMLLSISYFSLTLVRDPYTFIIAGLPFEIGLGFIGPIQLIENVICLLQYFKGF